MQTVRVGGLKEFLNRIKSISVAEIAKEANRPISVAVVGTPELREHAIQALFAVTEPVASRALPESPYIQGFDAATKAARFPREPGIFDLVIDVGGGREEVPEGTPVYSIVELGGWESTLDRILEDRPTLALALARNFPVFRRRVAQQIITETATTNAQFTLITGVAEALPITAIILPVNSLSDIVILTKNQIMMVLRLAAAYGLPVDYKSRMKELGPILVNAVGWRAIARELVGVVPVVGFLARAMISYAGTATVGKTAQLYYETGETVTAAQARRLYREAYEGARERVRALATALRTRRSNGGEGSKQIMPANGTQDANDAEDAEATENDTPPGLDAEPAEQDTLTPR